MRSPRRPRRPHRRPLLRLPRLPSLLRLPSPLLKRRRNSWALVAAAACSGSPAPPSSPAPPDRIAIIAAERGPQGARLVAIDERGDRQFDLIAEPETMVRDTHPVVSPDGRWIVFVSSRTRALDSTSLWIAPLRANAEPTRLTRGDAIDSHPTWTRDGRAIVFASTRDGGDFDLFRMAIADGRGGEIMRLTDGPGHEITPTVASDGTIYYAAVTPRPDGQVESVLEVRRLDGTIARVTAGPADTTPALSPDGGTLAFARPKEHAGALDAELWTMARDADHATQLVDLPMTDESGPVWSRDGRFVLATSALRGAAGNVLFSSVIAIDTRARPITARLLVDRTGPNVRLTPAVTPTHLDAAALAGVPEYLPELARIMAEALAEQQRGEQDPR